MIGTSVLIPELWPYLWIVLFMIATGCGLPLPEEVAIVWAGVSSAGPDAMLNPWLALSACLVGGLLGDIAMYGIGYKCFGWVKHHPHVAKFLHVDREKQMERLIARHGIKVFFVARFMVGVRGPLYIAAGMLKIPFRRFVIVDLFCASTVIGLFFALSYFFGKPIADHIRTAEWWLTGTVVAAISIGLLVYFVRHRRGRSTIADNLDDETTDESQQPANAE